MKAHGCGKKQAGREFAIDRLNISASDMHIGSCLLIMAQAYTIGGCLVTRSQEQSADCCVRRLVRRGPTTFPQLSPFSASASSCLDGEEGIKGGGNIKKKWMTSKVRQGRDKGAQNLHWPAAVMSTPRAGMHSHPWAFQFRTVVIKVSNGAWPNELSCPHPLPNYLPNQQERERGGEAGGQKGTIMNWVNEPGCGGGGRVDGLGAAWEFTRSPLSWISFLLYPSSPSSLI